MRAKDAAGAAIVAVAAPLAVAFFAAPNQVPSEHAPPPATTLELGLTASPLLGDSDYTLRLLAPGPLSHDVQLSDPSGRNRARIALVDRCAGARVVDTKLPGDRREVCVRITGLHAGSVASGALEFGDRGTAGTVVLSVRARHHFIAGPMLVALLGIAGSLLLASGRRVLFRANEEATLTALADPSIGGLPEWIARTRVLGVPYETRFAVVGKVSQNGAAFAADARRVLGAVIARVGGTVPAGHPVLGAAAAEQQRTDSVIGDFVDDNGIDVVHPAQRLAADLLALDALYERLVVLEQMVPRLGDPPPAAPLNRLQFARRRLLAATSPVDTAVLEPVAAAAEAAFLDAGLDLFTGLPSPKMGPPAAKIPDVEAELGVYLAGYPAVLRWANVAAAIGIVVLALVSVAFAVWMPSTMFGTSADYFTVLAAGVASGAGAGLVALWGSLHGGDAPVTAR